MNNLLKFTSLVLLTTVLCYSCGSSKSLPHRQDDNRHYNGMSKSDGDKDAADIDAAQRSETPLAREEGVTPAALFYAIETPEGITEIKKSVPVDATGETIVPLAEPITNTAHGGQKPFNRFSKNENFSGVLSELKKSVPADETGEMITPAAEPVINSEQERHSPFSRFSKNENRFNPLSHLHNKVTEKKITAHASTEGDALSLLWVIIIILLILWALGLVTGGFGLGGVIHVLLVIALILLILWLLRVL